MAPIADSDRHFMHNKKSSPGLNEDLHMLSSIEPGHIKNEIKSRLNGVCKVKGHKVPRPNPIHFTDSPARLKSQTTNRDQSVLKNVIFNSDYFHCALMLEKG